VRACFFTTPSNTTIIKTHQEKKTTNGIHQTGNPSHAKGPVLKNVKRPPGINNTAARRLK
jgi:hypothetical protein